MNLFNCERYKMYLNNPASNGGARLRGARLRGARLRDAESLNKNAQAIATAMTLTLFIQPSLRYCPEIPFP